GEFTQSVSRLQSIVAGLKNAPSDQLINIFESCVRNPVENIMKILKGIGETFCQHYTQSTDEQPGSHIDFAVNRLKLAEILYYKILETVMVQETRRLHGMDMSVLLEQDIFHRSLMACCLEIVLFAYSSPRTFPWIIEVLNLQPFYFYKVIEVVIRSEEGLSRDMVKHLNSIEEQILESLAWSHDSALWEALQVSANKVPTCEEVIFPNNFETGRPKRTGSLALFYRKVYHLASVRLRDLCLKLDVSNELRRKIWTCFEFTLVHCPDLMKDRHLDQLLLCAFYIMAKVTKEERTFQEIMKSYRNQPQANSHVYRSVLLKSIKEERGDLIKFYNTIYVGRVKSFALKYDLANQDHMMDAPPLSPFPHIKQQ
uniref:Retinoblastoma-like protein 1,Retinoblastoma-like protein 1 n=1 Tax=Homo sapiens TaxID=9606 RepID=UPI000629DD36|nr:Chain A, Retinoblastoma-like protein 1,Retinoblastoma-like protein 1 [Homo sapiens]4YOS_A Chain A, Retinoblastoma-like protein 1,Retinoblastoma-like protein 1 [Homo sapiens]